MRMTVRELIDRLFARIQSGELRGDDSVPEDLLEDRHLDPVEYLAQKYSTGSDADGQKSNLRLRGCESVGKRD